MPFMKESAPKVALCGLREIYSTWKVARDACAPHHMSWSQRWSSGSYFHKTPGDARPWKIRNTIQRPRLYPECCVSTVSSFILILGGMSPCLIFRWALGI